MQKNQKINGWIEEFLASDPPRSKSLVMTIFGDAIVPHGGMVVRPSNLIAKVDNILGWFNRYRKK